MAALAGVVMEGLATVVRLSSSGQCSPDVLSCVAHPTPAIVHRAGMTSRQCAEVRLISLIVAKKALIITGVAKILNNNRWGLQPMGSFSANGPMAIAVIAHIVMVVINRGTDENCRVINRVMLIVNGKLVMADMANFDLAPL
jgi:hypothetical protein